MTEKEILRIINSESWSLNDLENVAYTDYSDFKGSTINAMYEFVAVARNDYGHEWSDYDPEYPNNTYHTGFTLDGETFITGYSGIAGSYWNDNNTSTVCRP